MRIQILLFDGVEEQDFAAPIEVFGLAARLGGALTTKLVTTGRPGTITASFGTRVEVAASWSPHDPTCWSCQVAATTTKLAPE